MATEIALAIIRHQQISRGRRCRIDEFKPTGTRMVQDPMNDRDFMLGGYVEEILRPDPAMIKLRIEADDADRVRSQAPLQLGPVSRSGDFQDFARQADLGDVS